MHLAAYRLRARMVYLHPHFLRLPRFPAFHRPCSQIPISRTVITGTRTRIRHSLPSFHLIAHLSTSEPSCSPRVYHFTCHHEVYVWFCLSRVSVRIQERPERYPGMCCLDPVLRLATRSTGRAWRSVSRRFFFRFVSPRLVLLFHSLRTISLRFGESRLRWLAHLSFSPIYPNSPLFLFLSQGRMTVL